MPSVSKAQTRFMAGVASGSIKKKGLTKKKARDFVNWSTYKQLPARKKAPKK